MTNVITMLLWPSNNIIHLKTTFSTRIVEDQPKFTNVGLSIVENMLELM